MTTLLRDETRARTPLRGGLTRRAAVVPTMIGLLGFTMSVAGNWIPSIWYDEAATVTSATRSWAELWAEVQNVDAVHAAYYSMMHVVFDLVGYSPFTLRLPSAIAVGLTAAALVVLVRKLHAGPVAVIAGVVYCLLPRVTWMGAEGRSYALSALLAVAMTLVLLAASQSRLRRWWIAYGILVVVSCLVFVYLALIVVAQLITLLAREASHSRGSRRSPRNWMRSVGIAVVCLAPFLFLIQSERSQLSLPGLGVDTVAQILGTQWFGNSLILPIFAWPLLIAGGTLLWRSRRRTDLALVVLPALVVPMVILLVVTAVWVPAYASRYLSMCAPFVAVVIAVAIAALRSRRGIGAAIAVYIALTVPHLALVQRAPEAKQQSSWSEVAQKVGAERSARPSADPTGFIYGPLWHHALATTRVIDYSYPAAFDNSVDVTLATPASQTGGLWETSSPLDGSLERLTGLNTLYLVTGVTHDTRAATTATLDAVGWHATGHWSFTNVNLVRYER